jgi:hypothetical protein
LFKVRTRSMKRSTAETVRVGSDNDACRAFVPAFDPLPDGIEAQAPDDFLCNLFDLDPDGFVELLHEQAADLVEPPVTFGELLERLARVVPALIAAVRQHT